MIKTINIYSGKCEQKDVLNVVFQTPFYERERFAHINNIYDY